MVAVVVEVLLPSFHRPRHCQVFGMKNDRCYSQSSSSGLSRPPHFFKRPRSSSNPPFKTQVSVRYPSIRYTNQEFEYSSRADETAESHAPTADKVSRVFSNTHPHLFDNTLFEIEEGVEEVNFEDLALVHDRVLSSAPATLAPPATKEQVFTGVSQKLVPESSVRSEDILDATLVVTEAPTRTETEVPATFDTGLPNEHAYGATVGATRIVPGVHGGPMVVGVGTAITIANPGPATIPAESSPLFVIDTNPSTSEREISVPAYNVQPYTASLGRNTKVETENEPDSEDDVIVYDAPNPRISTPRVELATLTNIPSDPAPSSTSRQINPLRRGKFAHVVGRNARRGSSGVTGVKRKRLTEHRNFAAFGAMLAESRLKLQDGRKDEDPKEHLRRQGDSDLDWGDETDGDEKGDAPAVATAEGMELDPDLVGSGVTLAAMERFSEAINGNHVTMDDLEDATGDTSSDDGMDEDEDEDEDEDVESDEEMMLTRDLLADQDYSEYSEDDDGEELDPMASFQDRLDRLRKKQRKVIDMEDDEDELDPEFQWDEEEEIDVCMVYALELRHSHAILRTLLKEPWINTGRI